MKSKSVRTRSSKPEVGIIMGSDSDLEVMKEAAKVLDTLGVSFELTLVSAHRTPDRLYQYVRKAESRGLRVLIAGAGGAAHLPGMAAALTMLPVIGVPVKSSHLNGLDSLLSIVQMPGGIPVATVAINGSHNAGLLAAAILANGNQRLRKALAAYRKSIESKVLAKAQRLEKTGYEGYSC